jgi:chromosome segregation ATPase
VSSALGSRLCTQHFIVGPNGSGKSAVLVGLALCLGGKAGFKNRMLILEDSNYAVVEVTLRNRGIQAYRPNDYGDSILIECRISRDGSRKYKIKAHNGTI